MTVDAENLIESIRETFGRMTFIQPEDVPDIDLYMDQVTTFMDERLKSSTRNKSDDKLMTKTMINNYAKNDVIPPPIKKKYNKDHLLILIMIYYFKSILSISDIKDLMKPIEDSFFEGKDGYGIEDIYREVFSDKADRLSDIFEDISSIYENSLSEFSDAPEEDRDYLQLYSFICTLGCDVFVKKLLIEKIIDSLREHRETDEKVKKGEKENKYDVAVDKKGKPKENK